MSIWLRFSELQQTTVAKALTRLWDLQLEAQTDSFELLVWSFTEVLTFGENSLRRHGSMKDRRGPSLGRSPSTQDDTS